MIPPGLLVAMTLASAHATTGDVRSEAVAAAPPTEGATDSRAFSTLLAVMAGSAERVADEVAEPAEPAEPPRTEEARGEGDEAAFPDRETVRSDFALVLLAPPTPLLPTATVPAPVPSLEFASVDVAPSLAPVTLEEQEAPPTAAPALAGSAAALRGLSPDFVSRLRRVANRMRDEHGLALEVVEGLRPQSRQNELFARGRTAPGPVVTWTQRSLHTIGQAADVHIDGAPVTAQDASLLARIAREEGLTTLYPFDSGHIQIPGASETGPEAPLERPLPQAPPTVPAKRPSGVAPVAPLAPVAKPATVGQRIDGGDDSEPPPRQAGPSVDIVADALRVREARPSVGTVSAPPPSRPRQSEASGMGSMDGTNAAQPPEEAAPSSTEARIDRKEPPSPGLGTAMPLAEVPTAPVATAGPWTGALPRASSGEAIGEGIATRSVDPTRFEAPEAPEIRQLRLPLEDMGGPAALRVRMSGGTVDARLDVTDPELATRLREALPELRQRLTASGSEPGDLNVRWVADRGLDAPLRVSTESDPRGVRTGSDASPEWDRDRGRTARRFDPAEERRRDSKPKRSYDQEIAE